MTPTSQICTSRQYINKKRSREKKSFEVDRYIQDWSGLRNGQQFVCAKIVTVKAGWFQSRLSKNIQYKFHCYYYSSYYVNIHGKIICFRKMHRHYRRTYVRKLGENIIIMKSISVPYWNSLKWLNFLFFTDESEVIDSAANVNIPRFTNHCRNANI